MSLCTGQKQHLPMNAFIMHVGASNAVDLDSTVRRQRNTAELLKELSSNAPERTFFENDEAFLRSFPTENFHCWGVPPRALPAHKLTEIGDVVFFVPHIKSNGGGVVHIGIIKAICRIEAEQSSRVLWKDTPEKRLFPWLFFFDAETGFRNWASFLSDLGYGENWNPRGWYRRIEERRFAGHGGVQNYLNFIRLEGGFLPETNKIEA